MTAIINVHNSQPNSVFLKLHSEIISASQLMSKSRLFLPKTNVELIKLGITLRFGKNQAQLENHIISYGLKAGKLILEIQNAKILLETIGLTSLFAKNITSEKSQEETKTIDELFKFELSPGVNRKKIKSTKTAIKYSDTITQVNLEQIEKDFVWHFQPQNNDDLLNGVLQNESIGIVEKYNNKPCQIKILFKINHEDIVLTKESENKISSVVEEQMYKSHFRLSSKRFLKQHLTGD